MKRFKLKWKIYIVIGVVTAAIALMAVLMLLDNAKNPGDIIGGDTGSSETGGSTGVRLPQIDIPLG